MRSLFMIIWQKDVCMFQQLVGYKAVYFQHSYPSYPRFIANLLRLTCLHVEKIQKLEVSSV